MARMRITRPDGTTVTLTKGKSRMLGIGTGSGGYIGTVKANLRPPKPGRIKRGR